MESDCNKWGALCCIHCDEPNPTNWVKHHAVHSWAFVQQHAVFLTLQFFNLKGTFLKLLSVVLFSQVDQAVEDYIDSQVTRIGEKKWVGQYKVPRVSMIPSLQFLLSARVQMSTCGNWIFVSWKWSTLAKSAGYGPTWCRLDLGFASWFAHSCFPLAPQYCLWSPKILLLLVL